MITTITHRHEWDMGHRLPLHDGKCQRLHGHRYVAEIDLSGNLQECGPATGMVVDFYSVKEAVTQTIGFWDHRTMLAGTDPLQVAPSDDEIGVFRVPWMPTAENIAAEVLRLLRLRFWPNGVSVSRVRIYETPNGWAEAYP